MPVIKKQQTKRHIETQVSVPENQINRATIDLGNGEVLIYNREPNTKVSKIVSIEFKGKKEYFYADVDELASERRAIVCKMLGIEVEGKPAWFNYEDVDES